MAFSACTFAFVVVVRGKSGRTVDDVCLFVCLVYGVFLSSLGLGFFYLRANPLNNTPSVQDMCRKRGIPDTICTA